MSTETSLAPLRPRLVALTGDLAGRRFELEGEVLSLGRSSASHVVISAPEASRSHARVEWRAGRPVVEDLGSRAGTRVNGEIVTERALSPGDVLTIANVDLAYQVGERDSSPLELEDLPATQGTVSTLSATESLLARPSETFSAEASSGAASALDALLGLARAVAGNRDLEVIARALLDAVFLATPADRAGIFLVHGSAPPHPLLAASRESSPQAEVRASRTLAARALAERTGILETAAGRDGETPESLARPGLAACACAPLLLDEKPMGFLWLESHAARVPLSREHLDVAMALSALAAMPLDAARRAAIQASEPSSASAVLPPLALALESGEPLGLANAVMLRDALETLPSRTEVPLLFLDWSRAPKGDAGPARAIAERLALAPGRVTPLPALASAAPSVARLAALVAGTSGSEGLAQSDGRSWMRELLVAASLVPLRARHVALEARLPKAAGQAGTGIRTSGLPARHPGPSSALLFARRIAKALKSAEPLRWSASDPWLATQPPFASLDGEGPMGCTARGGILLSDTADAVARKIKSARTDAGSVLDAGRFVSPELRNLLLLHQALSGTSMESLLSRFDGKGYGALKSDLAEAANAWLDPLRRRVTEIEQDSSALSARLDEGSRRLEDSAREACSLMARSPGLLR